jgi:ribosome biogenesis GTPase
MTDDFLVARVTSEFKGAYLVKNESGEYLAKVTGKKIFRATYREDYPAVGDWVEIIKLDDKHAIIRNILSRSSVIKRKYRDRIQIIATNIDVAFVVESVDRDYNLNRFERYFAIAKNGGVKPAIILNKIDFLSKQESDEKLAQLKDRFPDIDIIFTSAINSEGLAELKKYIVGGKTYCFLGSSGVGKSSLINKLLGENHIQTGEISSYSGKGKHVTTSRQMYFLENGGMVIDNPGMREVGMAEVNTGIDDLFDEITVLARKCKYVNCTHVREPGCNVLLALKLGQLNKAQYSNYINLKKESEYYEMDKLEKREKDRRFGKFVKKVKDQLEKYSREN